MKRSLTVVGLVLAGVGLSRCSLVQGPVDREESFVVNGGECTAQWWLGDLKAGVSDEAEQIAGAALRDATVTEPSLAEWQSILEDSQSEGAELSAMEFGGTGPRRSRTSPCSRETRRRWLSRLGSRDRSVVRSRLLMRAISTSRRVQPNGPPPIAARRRIRHRAQTPWCAEQRSTSIHVRMMDTRPVAPKYRVTIGVRCAVDVDGNPGLGRSGDDTESRSQVVLGAGVS